MYMYLPVSSVGLEGAWMKDTLAMEAAHGPDSPQSEATLAHSSSPQGQDTVGISQHHQ